MASRGIVVGASTAIRVFLRNGGVCPGSRNGGGSHGMGRWVGRGKAGKFSHYNMCPDGRSGPLVVIEDAVSEHTHYMELATPRVRSSRSQTPRMDESLGA